MVKTRLVPVNDHGVKYTALMFVCPGCKSAGRPGYDALHMLPVNSPHIKKPNWKFDGDLERPTLQPSILTKDGVLGKGGICHSFLKNGVFVFLSDSTHELAGKNVPIPDLPDWAVRMDD